MEAIGRIPPFSFVSAVSLAPNKRLQTAVGVLHSRIRVINAVNAFKTLSAPSSAAGQMRSFRCCGSKPLVLPLELLGNDIIALLIKSTSMVNPKEVGCS